MKLPQKSILQKSFFTISIFALGIVASGKLDEKSSLQLRAQRGPASLVTHPTKVAKQNSPSIQIEDGLAACDYSQKNHRVCMNTSLSE